MIWGSLFMSCGKDTRMVRVSSSGGIHKAAEDMHGSRLFFSRQKSVTQTDF